MYMYRSGRRMYMGEGREEKGREERGGKRREGEGVCVYSIRSVQTANHAVLPCTHAVSMQ